MPTLNELRDVLSEMESAGDAAKVERYVLDPNPQAGHRQQYLVPALAAAAVVLAVSVGSLVLANPNHKSPNQPGGQTGSTTTVHPGLDQLTKTCLNEAAVLRAWGDPSASVGYGGLAYTKADGTQCSYEAENILSTHPTTATTAKAGGVTVYLASTSAGIRTGYVAFTAGQVAAYLRAAHKAPDPGLRLYRLVSIPADNPESVLVTILRQTSSQYPSAK